MKRKISSAAFFQLGFQEENINLEWNSQKRRIRENSQISNTVKSHEGSKVEGYISRVKELLENDAASLHEVINGKTSIMKASPNSSSTLDINMHSNSINIALNTAKIQTTSNNNLSRNFNLNTNYLYSLIEQSSELEMEEIISSNINTILGESRRVSILKDAGKMDKKIKFNLKNASKRNSITALKTLSRKVNSSKNVVIKGLLKDKLTKELNLIKQDRKSVV